MQDLTYLYLQVRAEEKRKSDKLSLDEKRSNVHAKLHGSEKYILAKNEDIEDLKADAVPVWVEAIEFAQEELNSLVEKLSKIQKIQKRNLIEVFSSEKLNENKENEKSTLLSITESFKKCETLSNQILDNAVKMKNVKSVANYNEIKIRENAKKVIATKLQELSLHFRKQQAVYIDELKKRKGTYSMNYKDAVNLQESNYVASELLMEYQSSEQNIDIQNINNSILELHSIFEEMTTMVIQQGTVLDRIDYNITEGYDRVAEGHRKIVKAEKNQSQRATKIIRLLLFGIVCEVMIIGLKFI